MSYIKSSSSIDLGSELPSLSLRPLTALPISSLLKGQNRLQQCPLFHHAHLRSPSLLFIIRHLFLQRTPPTSTAMGHSSTPIREQVWRQTRQGQQGSWQGERYRSVTSVRRECERATDELLRPMSTGEHIDYCGLSVSSLSPRAHPRSLTETEKREALPLVFITELTHLPPARQLRPPRRDRTRRSHRLLHHTLLYYFPAQSHCSQ